MLQEVDYLRLLRAAITEDPSLDDAHRHLADWHRDAHERAALSHDAFAAAQHEALLTVHDQGDHAAYVRGRSALTLVTDPPARVVLHRYQEVDRRLVPGPGRDLGPTPLVELPLEHGSYLLVLSADGHHDVRYPIALERGGHWHGRPPGASEPHAIRLLPHGVLGAGDCYVPAGWFNAGGDREARDSLGARRLWVDGIVVRRFPVTLRTYAAYLDSVAQTHGLDHARAASPLKGLGDQATPVLRVGDDGRFGLPEAHSWHLDMPVVLVDWSNARQVAAWAARHTGRPWRLLHGCEREKAARGVDGRRFPWGDHYEPIWACNQHSHQGPPGLASVHAFPADLGPYGIRGMAGNTRDWCLNDWAAGAVLGDSAVVPDAGAGAAVVEVRGGSWSSGPVSSAPASRFGAAPDRRFDVLGLRLAYSTRELTRSCSPRSGASGWGSASS